MPPFSMRNDFVMLMTMFIAMSRASPFCKIYKRGECNMQVCFPSSK